MKKAKNPLVVGNWKMNPLSVSLSFKLAKEIKSLLSKKNPVTVVIAPPALYLETVKKVANGSHLFTLGAQNAYYEKLGAHTGEISIPMLKDIGVSHVILGHSERREKGETDVAVNQKVLAVIKEGLIAVLCIGERARDSAGNYLTFIEQQIRSSLREVGRTKLEQVVIAYEPVWAIGAGVSATPEDVREMRIFIEKVLSDIFGRNYASKVRILYGGSVSEKNAKEIFVQGTVDGFLVGGASLHPREFVHIIKNVSSA